MKAQFTGDGDLSWSPCCSAALCVRWEREQRGGKQLSMLLCVQGNKIKAGREGFHNTGWQNLVSKWEVLFMGKQWIPAGTGWKGFLGI